ncbi:pentapeptide repeat-containing protein [Companilactobacillus mishanensis]|uniref:Pentapeptide repeat-containing protein n=1 Tax=Companilactobacillus mishanensis TaxID=2486008 RepID=A0A5P0ZJQ9_9LACO|nr:pentapeptide repeat-containing protein [Companilactobacillus mishanensis]MQS44559.1 pentapeptide repeat-containing protein [Companilactobacillus mishanensis]MQS53356.1 pentapeptide repeat-containing protein [Companilactobacillus mishanensis]
MMNEPIETVKNKTLKLSQVEDGFYYDHCQFNSYSDATNYSDIVFDHCNFEQTDFSNISFGNVEWHHSQLAGSNFYKSNWYNCKISSMQLSGADFNNSYFKNSSFNECKMPSVNFTESRFEKIGFLNCDLSGGFFQALQLKKDISFAGSNLTETNFSETKLKGFDFKDSQFETMIISPELARGLVVNQYQAAILIGMFGIIVE